MLALLCFNAGLLRSQHVSRDNYTGSWKDPASWNPVWSSPLTDILVDDITIYGYITLGSSLSFSGGLSNLIVYDTLIINGNLTLENQSGLYVHDGAVVIIRGNLIIHARSVITANGYLVITGSVINENPNNLGGFTSNDNPEKLFIGGTVTPSDLGSYKNYSALLCATASSTYSSSSCNYGNMVDFSKDQLYPLLTASCPVHTAGSNGPVCQGDTIKLHSDSGTAFTWSGPSGFSSPDQNPAIPDALPGMSGTYSVIIQSDGCKNDTVDVDVVVNSLPSARITSSGSSMCIYENRTLSGLPYGGIFKIVSGPGVITDDLLSVSEPGTVELTFTYTNGCTSVVHQSIVVNSLPPVSITSSDAPMCNFENRTLTGYPFGGKFSIISGPGSLSDDLLSVSDTGTVDLIYSYSDQCSAVAYQSIRVTPLPLVDAGESQSLRMTYKTHFTASLETGQTGEWSLVKGDGQIADRSSPVSVVTGLSSGENIFLWTVHEGSCSSAAEVTIMVSDLFVPSVITPNGDGKNDTFRVEGPEGKVELVIFNRWGNVEYENRDYQNNWDGRNNKGSAMPDDTYMYVVRFANGLTRKGTVLITR